MKRKFGWLSLILVILLAITACSGNSGGKNSNGGNKESGSANSSGNKGEPYEVVYAYPAFSNVPADIQEVQEAINKIAVDKINVKVKLLPISNSAFTNQINLMLSSGEKLDMFAMLSNYSNQVAKGALYPIGNIMEANAQGTIDALGVDYYNATKVGGVSYGVPSLRDLAQDFGIVVRKDIVDKYNIDLDNVKAFDDFEFIFKAVKENEPGMAGATNLTNGSILSTYGIQDPLGNNLGVLLNHGLDDTNVVNLFASEEYKQIVTKIREWYLAGYLVKDAATSPELNNVMVKSGKAASWLSAMKPGFETQESRNVGVEMTAARTQAPVAMTDTVTNVAIGVAATSEQPEKALQFLNLMYTDKEIVNLIDWGIEGKHYVKAEGSDNVIHYPDGVTGDNVGYKSDGWMHGNQFLSYVFEGDDPEVYVKMNEFNQSAAKSKALGFTFNGDSVKAEIAACNAVLDQYRRAVESGVLELDKALPEFLKKLDDAGINTIITEKQKQLDEWIAGNTSK
ncbi:ABC transporter substrate-binding protein [Paenibacillus sp. MMS20-IR301]|uniref:ABC transporter substrate-binding protein n=1 Tax=Paenibacillus sp. MMS20-IR301 TaxID=2895946 RepID=UPI0028EA4475|nr:ABC transporter substrate-binding protein [Paenibacillus sp. MMS20-IR301]WNS46090.1 ABC transporter substrate-binding protein [Paenibacillus sp. MMS20-IR301]